MNTFSTCSPNWPRGGAVSPLLWRGPSSPSEVPVGEKKNPEKCWMFKKKQKLSHWKFPFCTVWSAKTARLTKNIYLSSVHSVKMKYVHMRCSTAPLFLLKTPSNVPSFSWKWQKKASTLSSYSGYIDIKSVLRLQTAMFLWLFFNYHKALEKKNTKKKSCFSFFYFEGCKHHRMNAWWPDVRAPDSLGNPKYFNHCVRGET